MKLTYRILMLCLDFKAWKVVKLKGWWGGGVVGMAELLKLRGVRSLRLSSLRAQTYAIRLVRAGPVVTALSSSVQRAC
jgi:hypothetical protein